MGFAGLAVRCWHVGGVKNFKAAIFENQNFMNTDSDSKIDDIAQARNSRRLATGGAEFFSWLPGEHNYVFARPEGKDLKLLGPES